MEVQALVAHLPFMINSAYKFTRNREDAEDIAQEACIKAVASFSGGASLKSWVWQVVKNLCLDERKKWTRRKNVLAADCAVDIHKGVVRYHKDTALEIIAIDIPAAPAAELEPDAIEALGEAVEALPERQRTALVMHLLGYKYEEIATFTRMPLNTIRIRIFYAKEKLRKQLDRSMFYENHESDTNNGARLSVACTEVPE